LSERWWRRRKRWDSLFDDFSEESNRDENIMDEMMRRVFGAPPEKKKHKPYVFGFSLTLGSDANPRFRRFGNLQSDYCEPQVKEQRQPLLDVIEEERDIVVVTELPGVKKEDIQIHATQGNITISVDTLERKYHKELTFPVKTDPESAVATYKNGVLQVRLKKLVDKQLFTR